MGESKEKLEVLKEMLTRDTRPKTLFEYFFNNFAENPEFMKTAEETEELEMFKILASVGGELFPDRNEMRMNDPMFFIHPQIGLIHGAVYMDDELLNFFFFKDLDLGMMGIEDPVELVKYAKFTGFAHHKNLKKEETVLESIPWDLSLN